MLIYFISWLSFFKIKQVIPIKIYKTFIIKISIFHRFLFIFFSILLPKQVPDFQFFSTDLLLLASRPSLKFSVHKKNIYQSHSFDPNLFQVSHTNGISIVLYFTLFFTNYLINLYIQHLDQFIFQSLCSVLIQYVTMNRACV